jgi:hypothetical protein
MDDQLDVPLEDAELLAEVELTTSLIIAASEAESTLPQREIDRLLGLGRVAVEQRTFPVQQTRKA